MGGIGEDPPKRGTNISRVRASFFSTLGARTKIGGTGLVGLDKVLMFVKSIGRKERMAIKIKLEDGAVQMACLSVTPKLKEYAGDMRRSGRRHYWPQHGPRAAVKRE